MAARKKKTKTVGETIKNVRTEKNLTLDQIANQTGHTVDYLKAIEDGEEIPAVGTLLQISKALEIDSGFFLREQEENLKDRVKQYSKRTDNYAYTTLTPGAESKHLKAFRVKIDPKKEHDGVGYQHEGEEFVYLLSGKIEVIVGDHVNTLEKDDSLHFNSGIKHQMRNIGNTEAEMLVVIYGP